MNLLSYCSPKAVLALAFVTLSITACSKPVSKNHNPANLVVYQKGQKIDQLIGDREMQIRVIDLDHQIKRHSFQSQVDGPDVGGATPGQGLAIAMPKGLISENFVFGGVITKISDRVSETAGRLKLADLAPFHVRGKLAMQSSGSSVVELWGCQENCSETSKSKVLFSIPVISENASEAVLDVAALGTNLDFMEMSGYGEYMEMASRNAKVVLADYDFSTLVFDVENEIIERGKDPSDPAVQTLFTMTTRWYLKLGSAFTSSFIPRSETKGVGYFMTQRAADPKITRFSLSKAGTLAPIKYYIKDVPTRYRKAFSDAFDDWNQHFKALGSTFIEYEYLETTDPRYHQIIAGDIRYNVLEWDLVNVASYGGLGPSVGNQFTGEMLNATTLIQGPKIEELYTAWFGIQLQAMVLNSVGKVQEAETLVHDFIVDYDNKSAKSGKWIKVKMAGQDLRIHSQSAEVADPIEAPSKDFEEIPAGFDYDSYMYGYFREMVAHELGHNFGLRHNFRGNLGATEGPGQNPTEGNTSWSVMEYLSRGYRHQNRVSDGYDVMALEYGYLGMMPKYLDRFCTDGDQPSFDDPKSLVTFSAECSSGDATHDPFGNHELRLNRAVGLLIGKNVPGAPVWALKELKARIEPMIEGMFMYAATTATSSTWTNFFQVSSRPATVQGVKSYVARRIRQAVCDETLEEAISSKASYADRKLAADQLIELRQYIRQLAKPMGLYSEEELGCDGIVI